MAAGFSPGDKLVIVPRGQTVEFSIGYLPEGTRIKWEIYCDVHADFAYPPVNCNDSLFYFLKGNESADISLAFEVTGEYIVKVESMDAAGCASNMRFFRVFVTDSAPPLLDMGPDIVSCSKERVLLDGVRAENFSELHWSTAGDGTFVDPRVLKTTYLPGIEDLTTGMVTLSLTARGDCSSDDCPDTRADLAIFFSHPEIDLVWVNPSCHGAENGSARVSVSGGILPYEFRWTGPGNFFGEGELIRDLPPGKYTLTVRDASGCENTMNFELEEPEKLTISEEHFHITAFGATDGRINLTISGGLPFDSGNYAYTWEGPDGFLASDKDLMNLGPGEYTATITDSAGCMEQVWVRITEPAPDLILTPPAPLKICVSVPLPPAFSSFNAFLDAGGTVESECTGGINPASFRLASQVSNKLTCPETITRIYEIQDQCGIKTLAEHLILLNDNEPPAVQTPAFFRVQCFEDFQTLHKPVTSIPAFKGIGGSVRDNCQSDSNQMTIRWTEDERKTGNNCRDTIIRRYVILDKCENQTLVEIPYYLTDSRPPEITAAPYSLQTACSVPPPYADLQDFRNAGGIVNDNCGALMIRYLKDETLSGACPKIIRRTYEFSDDCGNTVPLIQTIVVEDLEMPVISDLAPLTLDCTGKNNNDQLDNWLGSVTATDNCGNPLLIHNFDALKITCGSPVSVTFTATDACGNTSSSSSQFTIMDDTPPVFDGITPLTLECTEKDREKKVKAWLEGVTAKDNCGLAAITHNYEARNLKCGEQQLITFMATDLCGTMTTITIPITVIDTTAPVMSAAGQLEIGCSDGDAESVINNWLLNVSATDQCSKVKVSNDYKGLAGLCGQPTQVVFTAIDDCGNASTTVGNIIISDSKVPVFEPVVPLLIECSAGSIQDQIQSWLNSATATDNCGHARITHDYKGFQGNCGQPVSVNFFAEDGCGNRAATSATITIIDKTAPTWGVRIKPLEINSTALDSGKEIQKWITSITAFDNCGSAEVTHNFKGYPLSCGENITVTFRATDLCGNFRTFNTTITVLDDQAPVFDPIEPLMIGCESADYPFLIMKWINTVSAKDDCGQVVITHDFEHKPAEFQEKNDLLITFLAMDANGNSTKTTGKVSFSGKSAAGISISADTLRVCRGYLVNFRAEPINGGIRPVFRWYVNRKLMAESHLPSFNYYPANNDEIFAELISDDPCARDHPVQSDTLEIDVLETIHPAISINTESLQVCAGVPITLEAAIQGGGENPQIRWYVNGKYIPGETGFFFTYHPSENDRVYAELMSDEPCTSGNPAFSDTLQLKIKNKYPVILTCPEDIQFECFDHFPAIYTAEDFVRNGWISETDLADMKSFRSDSAYFRSYSEKWLMITYSMLDICGNITSCEQRVTFLDTEPPVVLCNEITAYLDSTGQSLPDAADMLIMASDNCTPYENLVIESLLPPIRCDNAGKTLPFVISVTDEAGNRTSCTAGIAVKDTLKPVAKCNDTEIFTDIYGKAVINHQQIDGGSYDNCGIGHLWLDKTDFLCHDGNQTVMLYIRDISGNENGCTANVTVRDTIPPAAICKDYHLEIGPAGTVQLPPLLPDDGGADNCGISEIRFSQSIFTCEDLGTHNILMYVVDHQKNISFCTAKVNVKGNMPPDARNDNVKILAGQNTMILVTLNDADPDGEVDMTSLSVVSPPGNGTITRYNHTFIYRPAEGFTGFDSFSYQICDDGGLCGPFCDTAMVSMEVVAENLAPVAQDDYFEAGCLAISGNILGNDYDPDENRVTLDPGWLKKPDYGNLELFADGSFIYFSGKNIAGRDLFQYKVCDDGYPAKCDTGSVFIEVFIDQDCNGIPDEVPEAFFVPEGFSPNGDGINDLFQIMGMERFPDARIVIYNRLGNLLYEKEKYGNIRYWGSDDKAWWNGTTSYLNNIEEVKVPEGNYLFILDFGNGNFYRSTIMVTW